MTKLIFLDIDGVVNSSRSVIVKIGPTPETSEQVRELCRLDEQDFDMVNETGLEFGAAFGLKTVDPVCVALVNKLLEGVDGLVLCSSHRRFFCHSKVPFGSTEHLRRLRMYLTAMGFKVPDFFSVTGNSHKPRGGQVEDWLNMAWENGLIDDDDLTYVILDDSADFLPGQPHIRIDAVHGVTFDDYALACKCLGLEEPGVVLL